MSSPQRPWEQPGHGPQPPTAAYPAVPPKKHMSTSRILALTVLATIAFCFAGAGVIAAVTGDKPAPRTAQTEAALGIVASPAGSPTPTAAPTTAPALALPALATSSTRPSTTPAVTPSARPSTAKVTPRPTTKRPKPRPTTKKPKPRPTTKAPESVYYKNCAAVRAAGAAPIHRGDPGYARHLDRDGDGVGCE